ncbi:MAG: hypothetical protein V2I36_02875 [Desulfopila sp.]|nr:hypothetical protein [Desulfopila sp.]
MYSIQQQYNLVPGNYAKEMASVSVLPHLKSISADLVSSTRKGASALLKLGQQLMKKGNSANTI